MSAQQPRLPSGWRVTSWTREQAASMEYDVSNTYPIFDTKRVRPLNVDYEVWDSWLVLTENGKVAVVDGYHVLLARSQPITESNEARLMYFYSRVDEKRWITGGHVFDTPPVPTSNLVTEEIERINVVYHQEHYYLFVTSHGNKMTVNESDLVNRDFMLGWVSDSLFGRYEPLNGTGVVITQQSPGALYIGQEKNEQYVYSWLVVPVRKGRFIVIAYSGYSTLPNQQTVRRRSAAPVISLSIRGHSTRLGTTCGYLVPAESEC